MWLVVAAICLNGVGGYVVGRSRIIDGRRSITGQRVELDELRDQRRRPEVYRHLSEATRTARRDDEVSALRRCEAARRPLRLLVLDLEEELECQATPSSLAHWDLVCDRADRMEMVQVPETMAG